MLSNLDYCQTKSEPLKNRRLKHQSIFLIQTFLYSSSLSSESLMQVRPCGFLHASSSAMQQHPSVHASPVLLQEQFRKQEDVLHLHVVSSRRLSGAGAFVIINGTRSSLSLTHPWPSGDSRSCIASRACLHTKAWQFARLRC